MLSSFVPITPALRTQNPIRKRNGLGEQGPINLSMRPFSTLRDGYNFLLASFLLNTRAPTLFISHHQLDSEGCYRLLWPEHMIFPKIRLLQDAVCARCVPKITDLLRALGMRNHLETDHLQLHHLWACCYSMSKDRVHRSCVSQLAIKYTTKV